MAITVDPEVKNAESLKVPRPSMSRSDSGYMGTKRKIICFSDFDGTIFMQDTGHILFDNFGCGIEKKKILDQQIHSGERSFRDVSDEMWGSLNVPFEDGFAVMKDHLDIDPDFAFFHEFCRNNKIPFNVISAGLKPILRRVLDHFIGEDASSYTEIVANDAAINEDGSEWKPIWRHDTELGHDKALSITEYRNQALESSSDETIPMIIFIGDGVSDLPAAREADVLFARRGLRLEEYCIENRLPYLPFDTFADIQREVIKIARLDEEKTKGSGLPANFNPRANLWRRASSRNAVAMFKALTPIDERMVVWPEIFTQMNPAANPVVNAAAIPTEPVKIAQPAA
ncbi:hypothetical protein NA57DRAFT_50830 [Rhizodiscina lignyota]|uniref:2,3-diketo-5-methylthio-1-phosphopentane phosphatase n=1 Tax=Rhizodiscina lignyota TaxID=1504668 RepID=A0A9P4MB50_9PEZI|nr:hypothetical protein NA57DRAFT_50830 [Rhizodiscina lignyota]